MSLCACAYLQKVHSSTPSHTQACRISRGTLASCSATPCLIPEVLCLELNFAIFWWPASPRQSAISFLQSAEITPAIYFMLGHVQLEKKKSKDTQCLSLTQGAGWIYCPDNNFLRRGWRWEHHRMMMCSWPIPAIQLVHIIKPEWPDAQATVGDEGWGWLYKEEIMRSQVSIC